ncbi:MAG: HAMP domain-containing histidine kinase [Gammaproteobacteria bacterium]|nr:HAMP domain-containing histidine kinase [Gammaproteobacteria bacterium]
MSKENLPIKLDFSAIMASSVHDMKNSIQLLLGTLDEVIDELPAEAKSHARILRAEREGRRINDQLIQLLTLYKAGNTQQSLRLSEHSVDEFLEELHIENHELLALRGIELSIKCDEALVWFFDRELLKGVINNLITNAQQHTRNKIQLNAAIYDKKLRISVDDNGPGYPEVMLKRYGTPHDITPGDNSHESGGTGLGLFFSATIARLHKNRKESGYLKTSNKGIDGGARCTISLP